MANSSGLKYLGDNSPLNGEGFGLKTRLKVLELAKLTIDAYGFIMVA